MEYSRSPVAHTVCAGPAGRSAGWQAQRARQRLRAADCEPTIERQIFWGEGVDSPFALDLQQVDLTRVAVSEPGAPAAFAAMWALPLIRHAQPVSLEVLGRAAQLVRLSKGHTIFRRGDLPNGLYYVVSGSVKLLAQAAGGRDKVIDIFGDGQLFGEIGLFMDGPYRSWAQTIGRCVLLYLPKGAVIEAIGNDLGLALHFLHEVSSRAQILIDALTAIVSRSASARVAAYLLDLSARSGGAERPRIILPATKNAIASLLSLSPEALSRALRRFHDDGLIEVNGRGIRVIDQRRLRACLDE